MGYDGRVKGAALNQLIKLIERRVVPRTVFTRLDPRFVPIWRQGAVASEWYPEEMMVDALKVATEWLDADEITAIGYEHQKLTIKRMHTFFASIAGPERLMQIAAKTWSLYRDTGGLALDAVTPGRVEARVVRFAPMMSPGYAEAWAGAVRAVLESSRAKDVRITIRREPPETCHVVATWAI